jgi:hypothetical protein
MPVKRKIEVKNPQKIRERRRTTYPWFKLTISGERWLLISLGIAHCITSSHINTISDTSRSANVSLGTSLFSPRLQILLPLSRPHPSVTITVTPTPAPLTGFCLHVPILTVSSCSAGRSVAKDAWASFTYRLITVSLISKWLI